MTQFTRENEFVMEKVAGEEAAAYVRPQLNADKRKKKKSGAFGIFRAARFMMRKRTDEKEAKKAIEKEKSKSAVNVNGDWKMIVGSIRPLHVHEAPESPMHAMSPASDAFSEPSPAPSSASSSSSSCTMSQYASASNLRDLCNSDDEEDQDEVFDAVTGDEMIDSKAEEFIAQFYKQIYHQNSITPPRTAGRGIHQ